jgi:hypothetical protein
MNAVDQRGIGCEFGRFHHHGAAGGQGGAELARDHRIREVPWRDRADNTDRFLGHQDAPVAPGRRDCVAIDPFAFFGKEADVLHAEAISPLASASGLPISVVSRTAKIVDHWP